MRKAALKMIMKRYGVSILCLALSLGVAVGGTVSYSRYVAGGEFFQQPGVGVFAGSGIVKDVSALSFTNLAFWTDPNETDNAVSMNSLRHVTFMLSNGEVQSDGSISVSEVATEYSVMFSAPRGFATKLALQLSDHNDTALTSQFVLSDLLSSVNSTTPNGVFTTANPQNNGRDYLGTDGESFMTFDVHFDAASGKYTATSRGKEGTVITVEPVVMENVSQVLNFRLWDVEDQQSEQIDTETGGKLMPPLVMEYKADVECYRISFTRYDFSFPAGEYTERVYSLSLAPTDALLDDQLGGYLMQYNPATKEYTPATVIGPNMELYLSSVVETVESSLNANREVTLMGSVPKYKVGDTTVKDMGTTVREWVEVDGVTVSSEPEVVILTKAENGMTNLGTTKYYTKSNNGKWNNSNSSRGQYSITTAIQRTTVTTTLYNIQVREVGHAEETYTVTAVLEDGKLVYQNGVRNTDVTYEILDVSVGTRTEYLYEAIRIYKYRSRTSINWNDADIVSASTFSSMSDSMRPALPTVYQKNPDTTPQVRLDNETPEANGKTALENFVAGADAQAFLQRMASSSSATPGTQSFTRTLTYTSRVVEITPTAVYNTDETIPTDPFKTHLPSGIQKYFVATSFSKNYPLFVQLFMRQVQH